MRIIVLIFSIYVFIKSVAYGMFEYTQNNNKSGAIIIYILSTISLIAPNILIYLR